MAKRVVDGNGVWRSDKLALVVPEWIRPEYANLIPLALANGSFEASPRRIWSDVYSYNRPAITLEMVEQILSELERVKLLFRWTDAGAKVWGYWIGIEKSGRLPSASRLKKKHETLGAEPPAESLAAFLAANGQPMASQRLTNGDLGFGSCIGSGSGIKPLSEEKTPSDVAADADAVTDEIVESIRQLHPRGMEDKADAMKAIHKAILKEAKAHGGKLNAARYLYQRTSIFAKAVAGTPEDAMHLLKMTSTWFNKGSYSNPDHTYRIPRNGQGTAALPVTAPRPVVDAAAMRAMRVSQ